MALHQFMYPQVTPTVSAPTPHVPGAVRAAPRPAPR